MTGWPVQNICNLVVNTEEVNAFSAFKSTADRTEG